MTFALYGKHHASELIAVSLDGSTWMYPDDLRYTWGSNSPDYNNEEIDASGYLGIAFLDEIAVGTTVYIKYMPMVQKFKVVTRLEQPGSGDGSFVDRMKDVRLLDHAVELVR